MSHIKDALFGVFGEFRLPQINTNAIPKQIHDWKQSRLVTKCYRELFDQIKFNGSVTYMECILERMWSIVKPLNVHVAYAISICITFLNLRNNNIRMSKSNLKSKTRQNLVRLHKFV